LVGKVVAELLAWVYQKPLLPINHLEGHILSILPGNPDLEPPYLALVASGGHTELVHVLDYGRYKVMGRTRDDAAGEAFDKVSRLMNLGYPGGPAIDRVAVKGNPNAVDFPRPSVEGWDFSFSGLKTAVVYHLRDHAEILASKKKTADVCASFQASVVEVLVRKTFAAAETLGVKHIALCGGVSANSALRAAFTAGAKKHKIHTCAPRLCTDNGVMIAVAGYYKHLKGNRKKFAPDPVGVDSALALQNW
jgi:N6-L-threonylcarbamoyladenine synthase